MSVRMLQLAVWDYSIRMHLMPLLRECRAQGYEVVCAGAPGPFVSEIEDEGYRYVPIPFARSARPTRHAKALTALTRLLREERFDVLHAHTFVAGLLGRISARACRVPVCVYTAHGFRFHERMSPLAYSAHMACEAFAARLTDYLFVQNEEDRVTALRLGFVKPTRIRTIGSGIDLSRFSRSAVPAETLANLRRELGIPENALVVTTIARPTREKGILEFLRIAEKLSSTHSEAHFVAVVPEFPGERHSVTDILNRSTCPRLHRVGFRRDVPALLALTDVFLLPTHFEGYSRVIMEAMAMAVPVVASNVRGCRGLVREGETGFLIAAQDVNAHARAVGRLLEDAALRSRLASASRNVAVREFGQQLSLDRQLEVFDDLTRNIRKEHATC